MPFAAGAPLNEQWVAATEVIGSRHLSRPRNVRPRGAQRASNGGNRGVVPLITWLAKQACYSSKALSIACQVVAASISDLAVSPGTPYTSAATP